MRAQGEAHDLAAAAALDLGVGAPTASVNSLRRALVMSRAHRLAVACAEVVHVALGRLARGLVGASSPSPAAARATARAARHSGTEGASRHGREPTAARGSTPRRVPLGVAFSASRPTAVPSAAGWKIQGPSKPPERIAANTGKTQQKRSRLEWNSPRRRHSHRTSTPPRRCRSVVVSRRPGSIRSTPSSGSCATRASATATRSPSSRPTSSSRPRGRRTRRTSSPRSTSAASRARPRASARSSR